MRRYARFSRRALSWPVLALAAACAFFDPLDQAGLGVLMLPADTAVYVGESFQAHAVMVNAYRDRYPSADMRYAGLGASVSVASRGGVTGLAFGRAQVVAMRDQFADTGWVSVVPSGTLALSRLSDPTAVDVVNVDGSDFRTVAVTGQYGGGAPAWLPAGAGLVYQYAAPGGAGATEIVLTDFAGNTRVLAAAGRNPRVARDGSWVYYEAEGTIWRVRQDGTGTESVSTGGDSQPDPSPDGTQLVYVSTRFAQESHVLVVRDLTSGAERQLGIEGLWPRWSPDGDSIAYWSGDPFFGKGSLTVVGADGSGRRQVSAEGREYRSAGLDWSPDGEWLLARADATVELVNVTSGLTLPLAYAADYYLASWQW